MAFLVNQLRVTKKFQDSKQLLVGGLHFALGGAVLSKMLKVS